MQPEDLKKRTKDFALRTMRAVLALPRNRAAEVVARQLLRAATSVGANYRAACRARSQAEFISKMHIVQEEADETLYWLELTAESGLMKKERLEKLMKEASELVAITVASINTARRGFRRGKAPCL
ncbi:MAG: four helix bundle protein [Planctomycetota bacterium]|nr:four helix bundle protein [Planctomycetota bacterium]